MQRLLCVCFYIFTDAPCSACPAFACAAAPVACDFFLLMVARAGLLVRAAKLTCEVRRDKHRARGLYCVLDVWGARVRWVEIPGHASRASGPNNGFIAGTCVRAPCVPDWWRVSVRARQNKLAKCARGSDTIYLLSLARANFIMHGPGGGTDVPVRRECGRPPGLVV